MSFEGNTGDATRDKAQSVLFKHIGNASTRPRSIELAIRIEARLFDQCGKRTSELYKKTYRTLVTRLKDEKKGFDLNRRLLTGELAPEKWVLDLVPEKQPELVTLEQQKKLQQQQQKKENDVAKPNVATPLPAVAPVKPKPQNINNTNSTSTDNNNNSNSNSNSENNGDESKTELDLSKKEGSKTAESKYYFFGSTPKELSAKYAPKKVDGATQNVQQQAVAANANVAKGHSKWNTAGTYEERDLTKWAHDRLAEVLAGVTVPPFADGELSFDAKKWKVTGECHTALVRGKVRATFELVVNGVWSGSYNGKAVKGKVSIPNLDETDGFDGDYEIKISASKSDDAHHVCKRAVRKAEKAIKEHVALFLKELIQS
eukprot:TRINITY_DN67579_c4_g3_i1.p1 TRINITY_DN67579_c4_g3~~TRINITY_DN67579_c4_g3_i1.p1  ORF type:complete len:373 (-),score=229.32 TRINITY_DN67579_c4_g3_i1:837-1955(-)